MRLTRASSVRAGLAGEAGQDRPARGRRDSEHADRGTRRHVPPDGAAVARPVRRARHRRAARRGPAGPPPACQARPDHRRDPQAPAQVAGRDPLVQPAARREARRRQRDRRPVLAGVRGPAMALGDLQVLHRPRTRRQGHRHHRAVPRATGQRDRALRRREITRTGLRPDRPDPGHATWPARARHPRLRPPPTTTSATAPPPCSPPWTSPPATSPRHASHATVTRNSCASSRRSPRPTPTANSTSSWTTTQPTRKPRSATGSPTIPASTSTSPRHPDHDGASSRSGSASSSAKPSAECTFTSVTDLTTKIRAFTGGWNQRSHPFTSTKTPDLVLAKANRQKTSNTSH